MIEWHIEKRKISDLKTYTKNPRFLTRDQEAHLTISLDKFGIIDKPFINLDGTIIGGHQRINVLKKLEHDVIEVNVPSRPLTDKEVQELNIRHNKNTGDWDFDCLANAWEVTDLLDWGFSEEELTGDFDMKKEIDSIVAPEEDKKDKNKVTCPSCGHSFDK